jgi:sugar phosphate isomerase/epimerase
VMEATFINDEVSRDLGEAIEFAREERLSAIELRMIGDTNVIDLEWREIQAIKERLQKAGLAVAAISTPLFKCPLADEGGLDEGDPFRASASDFSEHLERTPKAARVASFLGTRIIRCFAFLGTGELAPVRSEIRERLLRAGKVLAAENPPVRFALENEHSTFVRTAAEVGSLVRELGDPFDVLWDAGNAYYSGVRSPLLDYQEIGGLVTHVHVKDPQANGEELRFVPLGQGEIDYPGQIEAWAESGYAGYVSLEPHLIIGKSSVAGARECLDYLRPLLSAANGSAGGSAGGSIGGATRQSRGSGGDSSGDSAGDSAAGSRVEADRR